jgi:hypothetical protein
MSVQALLRRTVRATGKMDAALPVITMWDDIVVAKMPAGGAYAYAGYVNGLWPTFPELKAKFPGHHLLDITVFASENATCLDIERGDASINDAPAWVARQALRGVYRPVLYTEASNMAKLERTMTAAHIPRIGYRLWIAHYNGYHLCSPKTCGYGLTQANGTQWTQNAMGVSLDQSVMLPHFFDTHPGQ